MKGEGVLRLLQLASPVLPVGAYSYSEGLEFLVQAGQVCDSESLKHWIVQELRWGAGRLDAAIVGRGYQAFLAADFDQVIDWNHWLSAARESEELRSQSWQMGRSLLRLFQDLHPNHPVSEILHILLQNNCNFAIAYSLVAVSWEVDQRSTVLSYLQSWATNLVNAGIKLIPLGQTAGQRLLFGLNPIIEEIEQELLELPDDDLATCGWGLALASMAHEIQYSRLFRS
jgi:urease accessory protein